MDKSPEAFRTISEVAESLDTPAHVLRFWESRFPQIKPVKRAGGRRYYRPADVALLSGIRHLLHDAGMTIRGVQKILREQGIRHVASLGDAGADQTLFDAEDAPIDLAELGITPPPEPETAEIVALEPAPRRPIELLDGLGEVVPMRMPESGNDISEGFLMATTPLRPVSVDPVEAPARPELSLVRDEPELPLEMPEEAPEAGFLHVEDEGDMAEFNLLDGGLDAETERMEAEEEAAGFMADDFGASDPATGTDDPVSDLVHHFATAEAEGSDDVENDDEDDGGLSAEEFTEDEDPSLAYEDQADEGNLTDEGLSDAADAADIPQPEFAGLAARLRALPRPVSPEAAQGLMEVQMRLGLLHAQINEAQRPRR
jgi:DNA-binding transcriptional MerR regulator